MVTVRGILSRLHRPRVKGCSAARCAAPDQAPGPPRDVLPVEGLPALTVERAIVDLGMDVSSAAGPIPSGRGFTPGGRCGDRPIGWHGRRSLGTP